MYDSMYEDVSLLLPLSGPVGGRAYYDLSPDPALIEPSSGVVLVSGGHDAYQASLGLDNDGYLMANVQLPPTGPVTLECWATAPSFGGVAFPYLFGSEADGDFFAFGVNGATAKIRTAYGSVTQHGGPDVIAPNTWTHYAWVRDGTETRSYINGVLQFTIGCPPINDAARFCIGSYRKLTASTVGWVGQIQDARVTHAARYIANFSPPARLISAQFMSQYQAILLGAPWGAPQSIGGGTAIKSIGGGADRVLLIDRDSGMVAADVVPDAVTGAWDAQVPPGDYYQLVYAGTCESYCDGPYHVPEPV